MYDAPVADKNVLDTLLGAPDPDGAGHGSVQPGSGTTDHEGLGDDTR